MARRLTDSLTDRLVDLLEAGNYLEVALGVVGISEQTFQAWVARGESSNPRRATAAYRRFVVEVGAARARGEARNVSTIASAARKDWRAAAWLLERQFPDRWARSAQARQEGETPSAPAQPTHQVPHEERDPFSSLEGDEVAERRARRAGSAAVESRSLPGMGKSDDAR